MIIYVTHNSDFIIKTILGSICEVMCMCVYVERWWGVWVCINISPSHATLALEVVFFLFQVSMDFCGFWGQAAFKDAISWLEPWGIWLGWRTVTVYCQRYFLGLASFSLSPLFGVPGHWPVFPLVTILFAFEHGLCLWFATEYPIRVSCFWNKYIVFARFSKLNVAKLSHVIFVVRNCRIPDD